jgi:Flp pilus assembly protein TadG
VIRRVRSDDSGFTLVELIIYSGLLVLVLIVMGGFFISTSVVGATVRTVTDAASTGQLIARSLDTAVRQASYLDVRSTSTYQFLVVRTATTGTTLGWRCEAWFWDKASSTVYTTSSAARIAQPTSAPTTWLILGSGITGIDGANLFTESGTGVVLALSAAVDDQAPVELNSTFVSRQTSTESAPCA